MATVLLIFALFSFICGGSFLLAGLIGMGEFEKSQRPRTFVRKVIDLFDLIFAGGLISFSESAIKNWKTRIYERHIVLTGVLFLAASMVLVLIIFRN